MSGWNWSPTAGLAAALRLALTVAKRGIGRPVAWIPGEGRGMPAAWPGWSPHSRGPRRPRNGPPRRHASHAARLSATSRPVAGCAVMPTGWLRSQCGWDRSPHKRPHAAGRVAAASRRTADCRHASFPSRANQRGAAYSLAAHPLPTSVFPIRSSPDHPPGWAEYSQPIEDNRQKAWIQFRLASSPLGPCPGWPLFGRCCGLRKRRTLGCCKTIAKPGSADFRVDTNIWVIVDLIFV